MQNVCPRNAYILDIPNYKELLREASHRAITDDLDDYNCGGFALGTFDWYVPYSWYDGCEEVCDLRADIDEGYIDEYDGVTRIAELFIENMVSLGLCRQVNGLEDLEKDEYLVAFRASYNDFHYARRLSNGRWFHKMGYSEIQEITLADVLDDYWWKNLGCYYTGKLFFLAVKYNKEAN